MSRKEEIFSKIQLKDYNNDLENVLETKDFSLDVKNLLLNMLYKIENGYEDYKTVKVNVASKKFFLKKIIQIVQFKCNEIKLVKPMSEESKILEEANVNYIVDRNNSKITVYQNDRMMLEALILLDQQDVELDDKYMFYNDAIARILSIGNIMSNSEVVRDFNGWSWDITPSQFRSRAINIVYQNLLILFGNSFMQKWITDNEEKEETEVDLPSNEILRSKYNSNFGITKEDMIKNNKTDSIFEMKKILKKKCNEELAEEFLNQLFRTALVINSNISEEQKDIIINQTNELKEQIEKMNDNKKYLEELSEKKKKINNKIKEIDKYLNNDKLLREEYENRNEKLPNKDKIFSVSHLAIMLEQERNKNIKEIEDCNKKMEPMEYVKNKQELIEKYDFYNDLGISKETRADEAKQIEELEGIFLKCLMEIIKNASEKNDISDLIYIFRYYKHIPYKGENLGKIEILSDQIEEIQKLLIDKACKEKITITFTEDESLNYKLLKTLFDSKIINLSNTNYVLKYHKGILNIQIFDTNIEEETKEIEILEKVELSVKLNKKIKVYE